MRAQLVVMGLIISLSGAGWAGPGLRSEGDTDACSSQLLKGGYFGENPGYRSETEAAKMCSQHTAEQIAAAKSLYDKHYVDNFSIGLSTVSRHTREQLECAKREFDATTDGPRQLRVSQACQDAALTAVQGAPVMDGNNLFDVLAKNGHATTFLRLVEAAGLTGKLKGSTELTIFAMSDEAFAKENPGYADWFIAHPEQLKKIVTSMIAVGRYPASKLESGSERNRVDVRTLGAGRRLKLRDNVVTVSDAVSKTQLPASNGVIYIVDGDLTRI